MSHLITVRHARFDDMPILAALEQKVWGPLGTPILSETEITAWFNEESPFFLVAEYEVFESEAFEATTRICGYFFGRQIKFDPTKLDHFVNRSFVTGKGFSTHEHVPDGNAHYGINIISTIPGTGRALYAAVRDIMNEMHIEYYVGFVRLTGLDTYLRSLETIPENVDEAALWYCIESARLIGLRECTECPPQPCLSLPALSKPDPMLAFHVMGSTCGLAGILPNYMPDPQSRNYGAVILSAFPHR